MSMPVEKAKKVLKSYKENNFNAMKALMSAGYSRETADKSSGRTIDTAVNSLIEAGDHKSIYEFVGVNRTTIGSEYKKIIEQDKNYPAKLRALEPLLKLEGITWNDEKQTTTVPILNLTVKGNDEHVAQSSLCDIESTAQLSDSIEKKEDPPTYHIYQNIYNIVY